MTRSPMTDTGSLFRRAALEQRAQAPAHDAAAEVTALVPGALSGWLAPARLALRRPHAGRTRTPTRLQMEAAECGAVALWIVLASFGRRVPVDELRVACGVSRDGCNALNLVRAARAYGLEARGLRRETLEQLLAVPRPSILFWNFNHFVVFEGAGHDCVFINDPATGPRAVGLDEFDRAFTGVVLQMQPGPDFRSGGREPSLVRTLANRLWSAKWTALAGLIASLLLLVPGVLTPLFLQVFVDEVLAATSDALAALLAGMALALAARALLVWGQRRLLLALETGLALDSARDFMRHALSLPLRFFDQRSAGDLAYRVRLNERLAQALSADLVNGAVNLALFAVYTLLMLQYDPALTAISLGLALASLLLLRDVARRQEDATRLLAQEQSALAGTAMSALQAIESIKAGGGEDEAFNRLAARHARVVTAEQRLRRATYLLSSVPAFLLTLNSALILILGGEQVLRGQMSAGTLAAFQSLLLSVIGPLNQLAALLARMQEVRADLSRLDDVLQTAQAPGVAFEAAGEADAKSVPAGSLTLRDVSFGYSPLEPPLLDGFSLTLEPGRWIALVGPAGSGKSTVARLALGLEQPWSGDVLLDGRPFSTMPRRARTGAVAFVDQTIHLFGGSIRDNLTLWQPDVAEETLRRAARDACIDERILALPGGFDAVLEENGRNLSGGERQRLEIARALVTNPRILILDEATSALDIATESRVLANLRRRGCAVLLITHRLSAARVCDEAIVLEGGRIIERGAPERLAFWSREDGPGADAANWTPAVRPALVSER